MEDLEGWGAPDAPCIDDDASAEGKKEFNNSVPMKKKKGKSGGFQVRENFGNIYLFFIKN